MVIILLILIALSLDSVWILLGETCCWSLLALKGLKQLRRGSLDGKSWDLPRGQTLADLVVLSFFSVSPLLQVAFLSMFLLPGQPSISNFVLAVGTVRALRQVSQIIFWGDQNGKLIETNIWFTKTCRGQMLSTSCMNPVRRSANPRMHSRNLFSVPRKTHPCY